MTDRELLAEAIAYAAHKHAGQTRMDGTPYIYHPLGVAAMVKNAGHSLATQTVAVLHDTLEDTDATEEELRASFGERIADAVCLLTRRAGIEETIYVDRILTDEIAAVVKNADKIYNLWESAYFGTPDMPRTDEERRFTEHYLEKTRKYYYGRFSLALDDSVRLVQEFLADEYLKEKKSPDYTREEMQLYRSNGE